MKKIPFPKERLWIGLKVEHRGKIRYSNLAMPFDMELTPNKKKIKKAILFSQREAKKLLRTVPPQIHYFDRFDDFIPDAYVVFKDTPSAWGCINSEAR
jgi:hypothetical protein